MIEILKQGPRLRVEAAAHTLDVNEAYLMVHNALASAMEQSAESSVRDKGAWRKIGLHPHVAATELRCPPAH